jgi:hypothetical protein
MADKILINLNRNNRIENISFDFIDKSYLITVNETELFIKQKKNNKNYSKIILLNNDKKIKKILNYFMINFVGDLKFNDFILKFELEEWII